MYKNRTFLAIIPARAGSKRLPNKNILKLNNKPLIAYTINSALNSKYIDKVIVSSDSKEILEITKKYKATPLKRPKEIANDNSLVIDAINHTLKYYKNYDFLVLLQPTSPLRDNIDIDNAIKLLLQKDGDGVISVCQMKHSPLWANRLDDSLLMDNFLKDEIKGKRSQVLPKYYRLNGAIYICNIKRFLDEQTLFLKDNIYAFIMDQKKSIDIDEEIDFQLAKILLREKKNIC
jgi:CMP-N-acetylneuraminic acid synthetase